MATGPKRIFIRIDIGDHLFVGRSNSAAKAEALLNLGVFILNQIVILFSQNQRCPVLSDSPAVSATAGGVGHAVVAGLHRGMGAEFCNRKAPRSERTPITQILACE